MDQARWLIVLSVVVCMSLTLGLLQYFAGSEPVEEISEAISDAPAEEVLPALRVAAEPAAPVSLAEIRYPEPPAHIFSSVSQAEHDHESNSFANEGKILP